MKYFTENWSEDKRESEGREGKMKRLNRENNKFLGAEIPSSTKFY